MRQILAEQARDPEFHTSGYVKLPMLNPAEVAQLLDGVRRLRPDDQFAGGAAPYHCSFLDTNVEYKRQTFELISSVFAPHVDRLLSGFRLLNANFYVKPPGTGEFTVHQNWPAVDLNDTSVTIWCPLGDVTPSNGAIQVVPGSHKIVPHVEAPNSPAYFGDFTDLLIREYLRPVPMAAGEALIFDDSLIHWSARNESDQPRIAIQAMCVPTDTTPVLFLKTDDGRFELIDADSEFYLTHSPAELATRRPEWRTLGYVEDRNRPVSAREFAELMKRGAATRAALYATDSVPEQPSQTRRFRSLLGR